MDFDNQKLYGDTSISNGLVLIKMSAVNSGSFFNVLRAWDDPAVENRQTQSWSLSSHGDNNIN